MKRRDFVLKGSLAGLLVYLQPWKAFASDVQSKSLSLASEHVRHSGMMDRPETESFERFGRYELKLERYYANGHSAGEDDLFQTEIRNGDARSLIISSKEGSQSLTNSKVQGMEHGQFRSIELSKGDLLIVPREQRVYFTQARKSSLELKEKSSAILLRAQS